MNCRIVESPVCSTGAECQVHLGDVSKWEEAQPESEMFHDTTCDKVCSNLSNQ